MNTDIADLEYPPPFAPFGMSTEVYDSFRNSRPICRVRLPSGSVAWLLTRYDDITFAHKDPRFSRDEAVRRQCTLTADKGMEVLDGVLQNTDGSRHARLRRAFGAHYGPKNADAWAQITVESCERALDRLVGRDSFDLRADFFEPAGREAANKLFGFPVLEGPRILELFFDPSLAAALHLKMKAALDGESAVNTEYFKELREARDRGEITTDELLANLLVFCTVSFEAVGGPLLGGIFALLRDPALWAACTADVAVRDNAVEEMLRCFPNGDGQFLRVLTEKCELSGVTLAAGDIVMAPTSAANMDPAVFPNPRVFDIHRPNAGRNVALGSGPHSCMGRHLTKAFMKTVISVLFSRLESPRLAVPATEVKYRDMPVIRIMESLPVRAIVKARADRLEYA